MPREGSLAKRGIYRQIVHIVANEDDFRLATPDNVKKWKIGE